MVQGDSSSLSAESKSTPAAAVPNHAHYKCKNCSRRFKTNRARCSHQNNHRLAREMRLKPYGAVLGAVLIHHIPSDDDIDEVNGPPSSAEPVAAPKEGTGSRQNPANVAKVAQTNINAKGKEPAVPVTINKQKAKAPLAKPKAKTSTAKEAPVLEKFDPQQQPKLKPQSLPEPQQEQELCTKDLLGEWSPMYVVRDNAEASASSWEVTLDLVSRVSGAKNDDLDLELKLCSENNEKVDLELKLGF